MKESNELMVGGKNVMKTTFDNTGVDWAEAVRSPIQEKERGIVITSKNNTPSLLEEVDMMTEEDVIKGMDERSVEDIINEVAEEENLTPEEVRQMVLNYQKTKFQVEKKKRSKPKKVKNKNAIKQAKKSKKQNRK